MARSLIKRKIIADIANKKTTSQKLANMRKKSETKIAGKYRFLAEKKQCFQKSAIIADSDAMLCAITAQCFVLQYYIRCKCSIISK